MWFAETWSEKQNETFGSQLKTGDFTSLSHLTVHDSYTSLIYKTGPHDYAKTEDHKLCMETGRVNITVQECQKHNLKPGNKNLTFLCSKTCSVKLLISGFI